MCIRDRYDDGVQDWIPAQDVMPYGDFMPPELMGDGSGQYGGDEDLEVSPRVLQLACEKTFAAISAHGGLTGEHLSTLKRIFYDARKLKLSIEESLPPLAEFLRALQLVCKLSLFVQGAMEDPSQLSEFFAAPLRWYFPENVFHSLAVCQAKLMADDVTLTHLQTLQPFGVIARQLTGVAQLDPRLQRIFDVLINGAWRLQAAAVRIRGAVSLKDLQFLVETAPQPVRTRKEPMYIEAGRLLERAAVLAQRLDELMVPGAVEAIMDTVERSVDDPGAAARTTQILEQLHETVQGLTSGPIRVLDFESAAAELQRLTLIVDWHQRAKACSDQVSRGLRFKNVAELEKFFNEALAAEVPRHWTLVQQMEALLRSADALLAESAALRSRVNSMDPNNKIPLALVRDLVDRLREQSRFVDLDSEIADWERRMGACKDWADRLRAQVTSRANGLLSLDAARLQDVVAQIDVFARERASLPFILDEETLRTLGVEDEVALFRSVVDLVATLKGFISGKTLNDLLKAKDEIGRSIDRFPEVAAALDGNLQRLQALQRGIAEMQAAEGRSSLRKSWEEVTAMKRTFDTRCVALDPVDEEYFKAAVERAAAAIAAAEELGRDGARRPMKELEMILASCRSSPIDLSSCERILEAALIRARDLLERVKALARITPETLEAM
eukprot:TRINITY_DN22502_c0_g1_i2.p1 TRINITY_DN22502_c0_g1~~TRINITY_DN22502_c0_g1_i2.p1  ORF type:complete len:671 (-),score=175.38 TRINITY_DN22502_c0_g1_i2:41-2053(-)